MESVKKRYISKLLGNGLSSVLNLIQQSIWIRLIGVEAYGQISFINAHFQTILQGSELGTSTAFFTFCSQSKENYRSSLTVFSFILTFIFFFTSAYVFISIKYGFNSILWPGININLMLIGIISGIGFHIFYRSILIGDAAGISSKIELIKFARSLLTLLIFSIFLFFTVLNSEITLFIIGISFLIFSIPIFKISHKAMGGGTLTFNISLFISTIKKYYRYAYPLALTNIVVMLNLLYERWFLQLSGGSNEQGYFSLASQIGTACFLFTSSMTPIFHRETAKAFANNSIESVKNLFQTTLPRFFFIAAIPSVFCSYFAKNILFLFGGRSFLEGAATMVVLSLYPIHQTYGQLSGGILLAANKTNIYMKIAISSLIGGSLLLYFLMAPKNWLIPGLHLGALALASKMVVVQLLNTTLINFVCCKILSVSIFKILWDDFKILSLLFLFAILSEYTVNFIYGNNTLVFGNILILTILEGIVFILLTSLFVYFNPRFLHIEKISIKNFLSKFKNS